MQLAVLDKYRIKDGAYGTQDGIEYGAFEVYCGKTNRVLRVLCSPFDDRWQHVSVSLENRNPNWDEMCFVKSLFWTEEDTVIQFHPKKSKYINRHEHCLHLWKKNGEEYELPPEILVG